MDIGKTLLPRGKRLSEFQTQTYRELIASLLESRSWVKGKHGSTKLTSPDIKEMFSFLMGTQLLIEGKIDKDEYISFLVFSHSIENNP